MEAIEEILTHYYISHLSSGIMEEEDTGTSSSEEDTTPPIFPNSQEMLSMVDQNDSFIKLLCLGDRGYQFHVDGHSFGNRLDYSRLGTAIAKNTNIDTLEVDIHNRELIEGVTDPENSTFYDGLKRNSSITELSLHSEMGHDMNDMNEVGRQILKAFRNITILLNFIFNRLLSMRIIFPPSPTLCNGVQTSNISTYQTAIYLTCNYDQ